MKKAAKTKKSGKKTTQKQKKAAFFDILRAFLLVAAVIVFCALVSCAVIMIHSAVNNDGEKEQELQHPSTASSADDKGCAPQSIPSEQESEGVAPDAAPAFTSTAAPAALTVQPSAAAVVENLGTLVFVIDDAGNNLRELEPFLRIPGSLTIAVLPGLPFSAEAARRIREAGKEVILHQPMEAVGGQNPGPGAIYSGMSAQEIKTILSRNVAEIGPVAGVNNHQGSRITMDRHAMEAVLSFCADHNLFFLDSRTTAESVVPSVARQMGIQIAQRNIFIDNEQNKDSMIHYIESGLARAQRNGSAVMIGHTWSPQLAPLLAELFPVLLEQGYTIKTAGDIIK